MTAADLNKKLMSIQTRLNNELCSTSKLNNELNKALSASTGHSMNNCRQRPSLFHPNSINLTPTRPRKVFDFSPSSPVQQQPNGPDSGEIERKFQEIMALNGVLRIDGQKYKSSTSDLEYIGDLGSGTCGVVRKMRHKPSGKVMAVKQMRKSGNKQECKRILMDLETVLKSHDCPFIVLSYGIFLTESEVWICMELMCTCLAQLSKSLRHAPFPERILGKMTVSIVKALHYLKETHGVIHRDVKPSNILLDEHGLVKLCDFGISGRLVDSQARTRDAGVAGYMAPERMDLHSNNYDIRADVWSLGITLVELATGSFPYKECKTDFEVCSRIVQEAPPLLPENKNFSPQFVSFIKACLTKDYKLRPKYSKLLAHSFIRLYESDEVEVDVARWYRNAKSFTEDFNRRSVALQRQ